MSSVGRNTRQKRLRKTKAQLVDELEKLERRVAKGEPALMSVAPKPPMGQSEDMLRLIIDSVPVGIAYFDRRRKFRVANETCRRFLGLPPAKLIGQTLRQAIGEKPYKIARKYVNRALAGETVTFENTLPNPDGGEFSLNVSYVPNFGPDKSVEGFFALVQDVTDSKRAEESSLENEKRFRAVVENSPFPVFLKNHQGQFQLVNEPFEKWCGFTSDEIIGKTSHDIFPKKNTDTYVAQDKDVLKTMKVIERMHDITFGDGTIHPILVIKFPIIGADNQPPGVGTINIDLTESKRAEEALREKDGLFETFVEHSPSLFSIKDLEGRYLLASREFKRVLSTDKQGIIGKKAANFLPKKAAEASTVHDRKVIETKSAVTLEEEIFFEDETHTFLTTKFPLIDASGAVTGTGGFSTDITERKRAEEMLTTAIESLPEGFAYFDPEDRLVLFNSKLVKGYPKIADVIVPGVPFETLIRAGVDKGQWSPDNGQDQRGMDSKKARLSPGSQGYV